MLRCSNPIPNFHTIIYRLMQKFVSFLAFSLVFLFISCKNDPAANNGAVVPLEHANPVNLAGHWIPIDFCARANQYQSVLKAMNNAHLPYTYAITFSVDQPDSVTCYNGFETWKLAAKINVDTIELLEARPGKSVYLVYDPASKDITMFDGTTNAGTQMDRMIKSKANSPTGYLAFTTALNHNLFEGNFFPIGQKTDKPVTFTPGGYIMNFEDYNRYAPCTGGDCFMMGDVMDVVTFATTKVKDSQKLFGFKFSNNGDTLSFYNLKISDTEKAAQLGGVAYRFLRKSIDEKIKPVEKQQKPGESTKK
jgi:hypothetical protein